MVGFAGSWRGYTRTNSLEHDTREHLKFRSQMHSIKTVLRRHPILWSTLKLFHQGAYSKAIKGIEVSLMRRNLVISCSDMGISNRIKCLLSCMRLAEVMDSRVALYWPRNWAVRCEFGDLFENSFLELDDTATKQLHEKDDDAHTILVDTWGSLLWLPGDLPQKETESTATEANSTLDFEYNKTPDNVRHAYLRHVRSLRPIERVQREVLAYSSGFSEHTISVSVRSWVEAKERQQSLFDIQNVFRRMDEHEQSNFFVSCDSEDILKALINRYRSRIISYPKKTGINDRRSRTGMQDILIDMLLLSKNSRLIASYLSTFPEVAWWFGGGNAKVEIIEPAESVNEWRHRHSIAINARCGAMIRKVHRKIIPLKTELG